MTATQAPGVRSGASRTRAPSPELPFINRELSWLEFNARVLHEAEDGRNPLLERVRFLAIFTSNLDEFFQVRVAGLKQQIAAGHSSPTRDGLSASEKLDRIRGRVLQLQARHSETYAAVGEELAVAGDPGAAVRGPSGTPARAASALHGRDLPRAHAARGRPLAPVPVHQRPLAIARGHRPRPGDRGAAIRADQGAAGAAADVGRSRRGRTCCSNGSSPRTSTCCSRAWRCSPTTCSASRATPTSRSRRTRPTTS